MSVTSKRGAPYRMLQYTASLGCALTLAACASDGARYAPPPPWSSAQQQYNQTFSQRPPVAGQETGWQGQGQSVPSWQQSAAPAWQPQNSDVTGSIQPDASVNAARTVYAKPLPPVTALPPVAAPKAQWTPPATPPQWSQPASPKLAPLPTAPVAVAPGPVRQSAIATSGQQLKLPKTSEPAVPLAWTQPAAAPRAAVPSTHTVHAGETLASIATQYGVPAATIARYNHLGPSDRPRIGQKLALTSPARLPVASDAPQADKITTSAIPPRIPEPKAAAVPTPVEPRKVVTAVPQAPAPEAEDEPVEPATAKTEKLAFRWPVRGRVIAKFGPQPSGGNVDGIKIAVPQGTPVHAAEAGVVAYAGSELKPYGNLVLVRHPNGWVTAYAHNSNIDVKSGDQIKRGQIIARAGQTGNVSQPQVHFEIRKGKTPVDPMTHLAGG